VIDVDRDEYPGVDQLAALPRYLDARVPAEYQDANGHLNVTGYLYLHDQAGWQFLSTVGIDETYRTVRQLSFFDLEHHLRYLSEVGAGDAIAIHGRLVARTAKLLHGQFFMLDLDRGVLASTFEFLSVHMSLETRRSVEWPEDVAGRLDALIRTPAALGWEAPVSGAIRLGRP
jgi:acyl-CoA thioester hydrolase